MSLTRLSVILICTLYFGSAGARGERIAVTTTVDVVDFAGARTLEDLPGPDGQVSLAEAVIAANTTPGPNTIVFNIATTDPNYSLAWASGTFVLFIENSAPLILTDDGTTIDGTTQTAFSGDTNPHGGEIHLRTTPPYASAAAFIINSDGNTVLGIQGFSLFQYGIDINGSDNLIVGNTFSQPGSAAIRVAGRNNRIGGANPGEGNRLSSSGSGVWLTGPGATGNVIEGNVIARNWGDGVTINNGAASNVVGGEGSAGNVIFRNGHMSGERAPVGANIAISGDNNLVQGNQIGLNESGEPDAGIVWSGVELWGSSNVIRNNSISGHSGFYFRLASRPAGIRLAGGTNNVIVGNLIGTDATGALAAGNGYGIKAEVWIYDNIATSHTIGGRNPGEGNVIAYSQHDGVALSGAARGIQIIGNSIFANAELGINLAVDPSTQAYPDTITENDPADADSGSNDLQNFPVITSAQRSGEVIQVRGALETPNPQTARVELFLNEEADASGFGEGKLFAGAVTPDATGNWSAEISAALAQPVRFVTATATDAAGNTSEFSRAAAVTGNVDGTPAVEFSKLRFHATSFAFEVAAPPGAALVIESSTNLVQWSPVSTHTVGSNPIELSHSTAAEKAQFFRARLQ